MHEGHLTPEEIQLVAQSRVRQEVENDASLPELVLQHIALCQTCGPLVAMHVDFYRKLAQLKVSGPSPRTPDCPNSEIYWELTVGTVRPDDAEALLQHATTCDHCSYILQSAVGEFNEDLTTSETELLDDVWRWRLDTYPAIAGQLAIPAKRPRPTKIGRSLTLRPRFIRLAVSLSGLAALFVIVYFAVQTVRHYRPSYAENLIAQAYTSARPFEPRIDGATYAPLKVERGGGRSQTERPAPLLEAEALIGRGLLKSPNNSEWLRARGQADLLDGRYDRAIDAFQRALDERPGFVGAQIDLATALYLKALVENDNSDFTTSADLLSKVIQKTPSNGVALFNRALVLEKLLLFDQAIKDWQEYLKLDASGEWASEARQHLRDIELKIEQRQHDTGTSLLSPAELGTKNLAFDAQRREIDQRIEEYLARAVREWLFLSRKDTPINADESLDAALRNIALVLADSHADSWLEELLSKRFSPHFGRAVQTLSDAILSSDRADYPAAMRYASASGALFRIDGNTAGILRAKFEQLYALQFSNNGLDCARTAHLLQSELKTRSYAWIRQQTMIEEGICRNLLGEFGQASVILDAAAKEAIASRFSLTTLRASVMQALVLWDSGKTGAAWRKIKESAAQCWDTACPDQTLYMVYANMDNFAEDARLWYLQVFAANQAVQTAKSDPDFLMRAVEHNRLASAAALAGFSDLAKSNFEIADRLLDKTPQTAVTANYQAGIQIDLAKLALVQNDLSAAQSDLQQAESRVASISDYYLLTDFFLTKGRLQLKANDTSQAEGSLAWAAALAEHQLSSFSSQRERFTWSQQNGGVYRELVELELQKGNIKGALERWEWFLAAPIRLGAPTALSRNPTSSAPDVFSANRLLDPPPPVSRMTSTREILLRLRGQTLISYTLVANKLGAWILDERGIEFRWVTSDSARVFQLARSFLELCGNPSSDRQSLNWDSRRLYELLIAPLERRIAWNRPLLIDGESGILTIPFAALLDSHGHFLLEKSPISVIPGTYLLSEKQVNGAVDSSAAALVINAFEVASADQGLYPLPTSTLEATTVAAKFRSSSILRGDELTLEVLKREIRHAVVLHYAGHSSPDATAVGLLIRGRNPGEVAILDSTAIRSIGPIPTRLVALSACSTAWGRDGTFVNEDSLPYTFLEIGVPHVIASRWNVDSSTTAKLMADFYDNLLSGRTVSESLRAAELKTASQPDTSAPYFWAAFGSYGTS